MKFTIVAVVFVLALAAANAQARQPFRLDASSNAAAESSWNAMLASADPAHKQQLLEAMLKINLAGVQSARELVGNPDMASFGIARVKDTVAGLTADQIIELGDRISTITTKPSGG